MHSNDEGLIILVITAPTCTGRRIPPTLFSFDAEMFLEVALPVIIFNAGFSVKKKVRRPACKT